MRLARYSGESLSSLIVSCPWVEVEEVEVVPPKVESWRGELYNTFHFLPPLPAIVIWVILDQECDRYEETFPHYPLPLYS